MELTNEQKKELAKDLFIIGTYTYEEIAGKVGVQRQTVSRWAKAGGWDEIKSSMSVTREQILKNLYSQLNEITQNILSREKGERYPDAKESDAQVKISAAIKNMEEDASLSDIISVGMRFLEWLRRSDLEKAKEFTSFWDQFIKESAV